jgi:hypothetical protein
MLELVAEHGISVDTNAYRGLGEMEKLIELAESGKMKGKGIVIMDEDQIGKEKEGGLDMVLMFSRWLASVSPNRTTYGFERAHSGPQKATKYRSIHYLLYLWLVVPASQLSWNSAHPAGL